MSSDELFEIFYGFGHLSLMCCRATLLRSRDNSIAFKLNDFTISVTYIGEEEGYYPIRLRFFTTKAGKRHNRRCISETYYRDCELDKSRIREITSNITKCSIDF